MRDATLCLLKRGHPPDEVLLGLKKAGFGRGKYGGFGGKVKAGETVEAAAVRELEEETGLRIPEADIEKVGRLTFLFPANPDWNQMVHVFTVEAWDGEPVESAEMKPAWFRIREIPFERMWQDCRHWLPLVLAGKRIRARFTFRGDNETVAELEMREWPDDGRQG